MTVFRITGCFRNSLDRFCVLDLCVLRMLEHKGRSQSEEELKNIVRKIVLFCQYCHNFHSSYIVFG